MLNHCPNTYREVVVGGVLIKMCPDFPVDNVIAENLGKKNSDAEFIEQMNLLCEQSERDYQYRRSYRKEFNWADTEGGKNPKTESNLQALNKATPHYQISKGPSEENQPRSILENEKNAFEFRRSGLWEWVEDQEVYLGNLERGLVGGTFMSNTNLVISCCENSDKPSSCGPCIGPGRLTRIKKGPPPILSEKSALHSQ